MEDVLGYYEVNDGWNGDKEQVFLVFDPGTLLTFEVHAKWGFFRSTLPLCVDSREVKWLLENHPIEKQRYRRID